MDLTINFSMTDACTHFIKCRVQDSISVFARLLVVSSSIYASASFAAASGFPSLACAYTPETKASVSGCCHILLFYGLGPTDLAPFPSGKDVLRALTDEQTAVQTFGANPFIKTRTGLRYMLSKDILSSSTTGETHRDQCLATFAALDLPLTTPIRLKGNSYSISDLLADSVANFSFDQGEPAWTAMAFSKYLPPKREWTNRFGEKFSFSELVRHLLELDLNTQSCAGIHILDSLIKIDNADRTYKILDDNIRAKLDNYLKVIVDDLVLRNNPDGSWNGRWCATIKSGTIPSYEFHILIVGHLLEALNSLDITRRPAEDVYLRSAQWLRKAVASSQLAPRNSLICPITHAIKSASKILESPH